MHLVTYCSCFDLYSNALGVKAKFNDFHLLFDGPFVLNFCVHQSCPLVDHVNGVGDPMRP
jgi:hypothetical protein